jgi:hypothetical protein
LVFINVGLLYTGKISDDIPARHFAIIKIIYGYTENYKKYWNKEHVLGMNLSKRKKW